MLYRGMDRKALDAAYNNTAAVGEARRDQYVAGWSARSDALLKALDEREVEAGRKQRLAEERVRLLVVELPVAAVDDRRARGRQHRHPGRYLPLSGHEHFLILEELARPDGAIIAALKDLALGR